MSSFTAEIRLTFESEHDELDLMQDIETAIWEAMAELQKADRIDSASHVDVEVTPEENE